MKKAVLLFLLMILGLQFFVKGGYVAYYHLNKSYIASTLCENKDKPKSSCQGKCYLAKKIKQQDQQTSQLPEALKSVKDVLFFLESIPQLLISNAQISIRKFFATYLYSYKNLFVDSILQPPQ